MINFLKQILFKLAATMKNIGDLSISFEAKGIGDLSICFKESVDCNARKMGQIVLYDS